MTDEREPGYELLIMRHAEAEHGSAGGDVDRALTRRGAADARDAATWLRRQSLTPDYLLSSPAVRARQTALAVCAELTIESSLIDWRPAIYEAALNDLLGALASRPARAQRVLLVGHNPGLERLLIHLADDLPETPGGLMSTATIARLRLPAGDAGLQMQGGRLLQLRRPARD